MIKNFLIGFVLLTIVVVVVLGRRGEHRTSTPIEFFGDMKRQDKIKYQKPSEFFADGRAARPPVNGTIPMGYDIPGHPTQNLEVPADISSPYGEYSAGTDYYNTGKMGDQWGTGIPLPVTEGLLRRGQQVYRINCAVCHGETGQGNGITSKYGLVAIANYHSPKYREMADGHIYNTITHGYNTMMGYGDKITVKDRWAVIAYLRALQRSQYAKLADVPEAERPALEKPAEGTASDSGPPAPTTSDRSSASGPQQPAPQGQPAAASSAPSPQKH
jgi:mono/diheme cytochrome c family protein